MPYMFFVFAKKRRFKFSKVFGCKCVIVQRPGSTGRHKITTIDVWYYLTGRGMTHRCVYIA